VKVLAALALPQPSQRGRFHSPSWGGSRPAFEEPDSNQRELHDGRVRLPIGDSPRRLAVWLRRQGAPDSALEGIEPREVTAAAAGAVLEVRVPAPSWARACAELEQARPK
jgi:hypothetical protein